MMQNAPDDRPELATQWSGFVVLTVFRCDALHLLRHLRITVGGNVWEEVMLDLMTEIARKYVEQRSAL